MAYFVSTLAPRYPGDAILGAERAASGLDSAALSRHLLVRDNFLARQERVLNVLRAERLFRKEYVMNLSRPERYHLGLARAKAIRRLGKKHDWDHDDYNMAEYLNDEPSPFFLHMTMFGTQCGRLAFLAFIWSMLCHQGVGFQPESATFLSLPKSSD